MSAFAALVAQLEPEIEDPEEETFLLYSQPMPSQNLGFVDRTAAAVDVSVAGRDYVIHQSPAVLSSNRAGGTTGAVLWRITPAFAEWLAAPANVLFGGGSTGGGALSEASVVLELGCGISPLTGLALAPRVARYVLTDQPYVQRLLQKNLDANSLPLPSSSSAVAGGRGRSSRGRRAGARAQVRGAAANDNVTFTPLDWETDAVAPGLTGSASARSFDAVVACDCVYNYALAQPLVQTCIDACRLRDDDADAADDAASPCLCIIAQQLRNDDVFEAWLKLFHGAFRVWRFPDAMLPAELASTAGFVVHLGVLRGTKRLQ